MSELANKVIVITGGAGLVGQAFVRKLLDCQATVVIAEKDLVRANEFKASLAENLQANCAVIDMDITSTSSVKAAIENVHLKYGHIDALVNNAYPRNSHYGASFFDVQYDDFCENMSLNVGGYFLCSQQFALYFKDQGQGNIVNIASIYGCIAPKFEIYDGLNMTMPVEYAAIKAALIHLSKFMAKAFKGMNIRVNCLSPGGIYDNHSEQFTNAYAKQCINKGMLDPVDLSGSLVFLLSDSSNYVNGQNIIVDDGFTL
ncbi:flagellin modification protein A [Photobacterium sagamiensis]|uniref:oxidoreductase n=1 Tax=Photobacterium sagamiensis TaxID=2910241 RepID=UPI003D0A7275